MILFLYPYLIISLPMMVFPDKEQVTWTICHLLSISTLQCHYIKSIATINFSSLTFTELYTHGTNYHLVFAKFPHTSGSSSKLKISCGIK